MASFPKPVARALGADFNQTQPPPSHSNIKKYTAITAGSLLTVAGVTAGAALIAGVSFVGSVALPYILAGGLIFGPIFLGYGISRTGAPPPLPRKAVEAQEPVPVNFMGSRVPSPDAPVQKVRREAFADQKSEPVDPTGREQAAWVPDADEPSRANDTATPRPGRWLDAVAKQGTGADLHFLNARPQQKTAGR